MPSSPKVSAAMEAKEQTSAQELPEGGMQVQKSPEPEVLSTQEDLFDQSNKTGTNCLIRAILLLLRLSHFSRVHLCATP